MSDGRHRFINDEMGISALFPRGVLVCMGRSGDTPRGFYAWLGVKTNCREQSSAHPPGAIGITSAWNALDLRPTRGNLRQGCESDAKIVTRIRGVALSLPGQRSLICQSRSGGETSITIAAFAGPVCRGAPAVQYSAFLFTTPRRFDADFTLFRTFVKKIKIGAAQADC